MSENSIGPRAFYGQGPQRRYAGGEAQQSDPDLGDANETERPLPEPAAGARMAACPGAILDSAPGGGGLGVWLLVEEGGGYCTYEYGGGIA
jgi:hypothetical protein